MEKDFKVWCKNKNEWETHDCFLNQNGDLFHITTQGLMPLKPDTHVALFYLGVKDKKGVKIYEGDILKHEKYVVVVDFREGGICYSWPFDTLYKDVEEIKECEVIGNIYGVRITTK